MYRGIIIDVIGTIMSSRYWLLPEDVVEWLPPDADKALQLEQLMLQTMRSWGYEVVIPPLVEYLSSLLAGSGVEKSLAGVEPSLARQTLKVTDQQSGQLMGIRADMTPQIARIDAHRLPHQGESRYCYSGDVLRARSESTEPRRNPRVFGAELFGVSSVGGDIEIMALLLDLMTEAGIKNTVLDIGHAGIAHALIQTHQLSASEIQLLHEILAQKRRPDVDLLEHQGLIRDVQFLLDAHLQPEPLKALLKHFGDNDHFSPVFADLMECQRLLSALPENQNLTFDIGSVGSYGYHSGLIFSVYADGHYGAVARGGRYDGVGEAYGRARPATGFSADLWTLMELSGLMANSTVPTVESLPKSASQWQMIKQRRQAGERIRFQHQK